MENKIYFGAQKSISLLGAIILLLGLIFVIFLANLMPSPLNYVFYIFGVIVFLFALLFLVKSSGSFAAEVTDNGTIEIKRGIGKTSEIEINSIKFVGDNNVVILQTTKDNIISITVADEEDRKNIKQFNPEKIIGAVTGWSRMKYGLEALKNAGKNEYQKGIGPYSFAFVSDESKVVKIKLKLLTVINFLGKNDIQEPTIYVSLKDPDKFISENKK